MAFNGQELGFSEKEGDSGQCSVSVSLSRPRPLAEHVLRVVWAPQGSGPGQNNRGSSASIQESSGVPTPASDTCPKEGKDWRSRTQRGGSPGLGWFGERRQVSWQLLPFERSDRQPPIQASGSEGSDPVCAGLPLAAALRSPLQVC